MVVFAHLAIVMPLEQCPTSHASARLDTTIHFPLKYATLALLLVRAAMEPTLTIALLVIAPNSGLLLSITRAPA